MAETALSGAVPALPVVRPGKQKGFCCWYSRICFELSPWFSRFTLHFARLSWIFNKFRLHSQSRALHFMTQSSLRSGGLFKPHIFFNFKLKASSSLFSQSPPLFVEMITTTWKQINQLLQGGYSSSSQSKLFKRCLLGLKMLKLAKANSFVDWLDL